MTIPSKTRRTFTRNNFAEHNYNYTHSSKTNYPPRNNNNHDQIRSRYWNNPMATTNSVNFQANPHPPQDHSENYPFFQQNKKKNKHLIKRITYPLMMIIYNQIYLHHIPKNIADKECRNHIHIIEIFPPHQIDTQNQQPIQMQNPINTQSFQPIQPQNTRINQHKCKMKYHFHIIFNNTK